MTALNPSTSPGPATLRIRTFPSREVVESFTRPEQTINAPRGRCPSMKSSAPPGYEAGRVMALNERNRSEENPQNQFDFRNLQLTQLSGSCKDRVYLTGSSRIGKFSTPCRKHTRM